MRPTSAEAPAVDERRLVCRPSAGGGVRALCRLVVVGGVDPHLQHAFTLREIPRLVDKCASDPLAAETLVDVELVEEDARVTVDPEQDVCVGEAGELAIDLRDQ